MKSLSLLSLDSQIESGERHNMVDNPKSPVILPSHPVAKLGSKVSHYERDGTSEKANGVSCLRADLLLDCHKDAIPDPGASGEKGISSHLLRAPFSIRLILAFLSGKSCSGKFRGSFFRTLFKSSGIINTMLLPLGFSALTVKSFVIRIVGIAPSIVANLVGKVVRVCASSASLLSLSLSAEAEICKRLFQMALSASFQVPSNMNTNTLEVN